MGNDRKRIDANFTELLQEFRVAQQGVQILFAFLLSLPFQNRFSILESPYQRWLYAGALMSALLSTILFVAPVSHHRILFHKGLKAVIVDFASVLAQAALALMIISMLTSIFLIFSAVFGVMIAAVFTSFGALMGLIFWYAVPIRFHHQRDD